MGKKVVKQRSQKQPVGDADIGAAFMAWYADAIAEYPDGLITQAQAARILGISRMALSRLVTRGYLRAVYFPKEPDVVGVSIGQDDPTWLKLLGWFGRGLGLDETYAFPQACYVAFGDVIDLWERGEAKKKCEVDWNEVIATGLNTGSSKSIKKSNARLREIVSEKRKQSEFERAARGGRSEYPASVEAERIRCTFARCLHKPNGCTGRVRIEAGEPKGGFVASESESVG